MNNLNIRQRHKDKGSVTLNIMRGPILGGLDTVIKQNTSCTSKLSGGKIQTFITDSYN